MLGEATLTFKKVLQIAHAMETADMNSKNIEAAKTSVPQSAVHCLLKKKGKPMKSFEVITHFCVGERI